MRKHLPGREQRARKFVLSPDQDDRGGSFSRRLHMVVQRLIFLSRILRFSVRDILAHMHEYARQIKNRIEPLLRERGVVRSALFGSCARGEQRADSDVDLLVELPAGTSLLDFVDLKLSLEDALQTRVDLVEFDTIKPRLREKILAEQVVIYE